MANAPQPRFPVGMADEPEPEPESDPVEIEIRDSIDLHVFAPRDIPAVVEGYLEAAHERGFGEVRLIHGKGKGFQRGRVREILEACPFVTDYFDAPPARGFWGATVARLAARGTQDGSES